MRCSRVLSRARHYKRRYHATTCFSSCLRHATSRAHAIATPRHAITRHAIIYYDAQRAITLLLLLCALRYAPLLSRCATFYLFSAKYGASSSKESTPLCCYARAAMPAARRCAQAAGAEAARQESGMRAFCIHSAAAQNRPLARARARVIRYAWFYGYAGICARARVEEASRRYTRDVWRAHALQQQHAGGAVLRAVRAKCEREAVPARSRR